MKYYNTTQLNKSIVLSMFLFLHFGAFAQLGTLSPYSGFGIGELNSSTSINRVGVGGMTAAWKDYFSINSANPATYSQLVKTTFQVEGFGKNVNFSNGSENQTLNLSGIDNINFVFKKKNGRHAFALGLHKFATTGYNVSDQLSSDDFGDLTYHYEGSGGISVFNFGYSHEIKIKGFTGLLESKTALDSLNKEKLRIVRYRIAFGANSDWYFGVTNKLQRTEFEDNSYLNTKIKTQAQVKDVNFTLGVHANINLYNKGLLDNSTKKRLDLLLGASYTFGNELQTTFSSLKSTYVINTLDEQILIDTISFQDPTQGYMAIPQKIDIGFGLLKQVKGTSIQWGFNFTTQDWTTFETKIGDDIQTSTLDKSTIIATGFEYTPQLPDKDYAYYKVITYRVGGRLHDTYLTINNQKIEEKVLTAGISLPFLRSDSYSKMNLGMEFGTRGTTEAGLIQEQFTNILIGFTFTPHNRNNRWFLVRKNK